MRLNRKLHFLYKKDLASLINVSIIAGYFLCISNITHGLQDASLSNIIILSKLANIPIKGLSELRENGSQFIPHAL
jgi:hypothetical protein